MDDEIYDVGLSFSSFDRPFVEELSRGLKILGVLTFLDTDFKPQLVGEELTEKLPDIYKNKSCLYVPIISKNYIKSNWAKREKRAAFERALATDGFVIPVRLDDTEVSGLSGTLLYLDAKKDDIEEIADTIATKLLQSRISQIRPEHICKRVKEYSVAPVALSPITQGLKCPLGQAHMLIACEIALHEIFSTMWTAWRQDNSANKYETEQPFPQNAAQALVNKISSSWPSYSVQISFVDHQLNILSHLDLPTGFDLQESNLPKELKSLLKHWRQQHEEYGFDDTDNETHVTFSWADNILSSSLGQRHSIPRRNIGTVYPNQHGGLGSGPKFPEVYIFGETHLR